MNYAQIRKYDVSNAPFVNSTIFFSGCAHKCEGCFNKEAQDFNFGNEFNEDVEDLFISYVADPNIKGACLLGGEPFQQDLDVLLRFVRRIKTETGKPVWVWSGYTWDELISDTNKLKILENVDVLIDGRFELDKRDLKLKYRGSSNQRVIDVRKSLESNEVVLKVLK